MAFSPTKKTRKLFSAPRRFSFFFSRHFNFVNFGSQSFLLLLLPPTPAFPSIQKLLLCSSGDLRTDLITGTVNDGVSLPFAKIDFPSATKEKKNRGRRPSTKKSTASESSLLKIGGKLPPPLLRLSSGQEQPSAFSLQPFAASLSTIR